MAVNFPIDNLLRGEKGSRLTISELDLVLQDHQDAINDLASRNLYIAGEDITKGRSVMVIGGALYHFQPTLANHSRCIGVSEETELIGGLVHVSKNSVVVNVGFPLVPGNKYYASTNGVLTDVIPTSGIIQVIGEAQSLTDFSVRLQSPIELI